MASPDIASKRWIWEQYDHMVMGDTIGRPGGDAAIVRVHGTDKALAITTDVTPRYCEADAFEGGKQAVAENWRNLTAVGATPLAITDCLNFGNPERPDIMGQFVAAIHGMGKACRALDFPVVSGNVSLYNETNGQAILPTPAVGSIGLIKDAAKRAHIAPEAGQELLLIGGGGTHLGASLYLREVLGREDGAPPTVDLERERKTGDFIRGLIEAGKLSTVHDISGGGLLVALTQMALAGKCGLDLTAASPTDTPHAFWFGEDQARYIIGTHDAQNMLSAAEAAGIAAMRLGQANASKQLKISDAETISMATLASAHESWLPSLMN
jgi:phosphoribosylformylglycinamidine synthase